MYSKEARLKAAAHCFANGECLARTMRELGYPSDGAVLARRIDGIAPGRRVPKGTTRRKYDGSFRAEAVAAVESGMTAAAASWRRRACGCPRRSFAA